MLLGNIIGDQSAKATVLIPKTPISDYWPSIKEAGFESIDAVVHVGPGEVFMFRGRKYIQVTHIVPGEHTDKLRGPPALIDKDWAPLKEEGFEYVDAILSMGGGEAYVFRRNQYLRMAEIKRDRPGGVLEVKARDIRDNWKSFRVAEVGSVEATLSVGDTTGYVFAGPLSFYMKHIVMDEAGEIITTPVDISTAWPALKGLWW